MSHNQVHVFNIPEPIWRGPEAMAAVQKLEDEMLIERLNNGVYEITDQGRKKAETVHPDVLVNGRSAMFADVLCKHCRATIGSINVMITGQSGLRVERDRLATEHMLICPANRSTRESN